MPKKIIRNENKRDAKNSFLKFAINPFSFLMILNAMMIIEKDKFAEEAKNTINIGLLMFSLLYIASIKTAA